MLGVHAGHDGLLGVAAAEDRADHAPVAAVLGRLLGLDGRGLQQPGDHGGEHLDVADLLGGDVQEHVAVLGRAAAVPPLEEVGHHHADLAPLAAEHLLHLLGEDGVRGVGLGVVLEPLGVGEHLRSFPSDRL